MSIDVHRACKVLLFDDAETAQSGTGSVFPQGLSRREALRWATIFAGAIVVATVIPISRKRAMANPLVGLLGAALVAGAVSWFVNRTLNRRIPRDSQSLGVTRVAQATPTRNAFHNAHADSYVIRNVRIPPTYSHRYGYYAGLASHLRADGDQQIPDHKDLNATEIRRVCQEEPYYGTLLYPCGEREPPVGDDFNAFRRTSEAYGADSDRLALRYVRPFNDGETLRSGFGVQSKRTGQKDLLIEV